MNMEYENIVVVQLCMRVFKKNGANVDRIVVSVGICSILHASHSKFCCGIYRNTRVSTP